MTFNSLIPELTVKDIGTTKRFYTDTLGFKMEYERREDRFIFLSLEGNQLMFEEINGHWETGELEYPFGRGINLEMTVSDITGLYDRIVSEGIPLFREMRTTAYRTAEGEMSQAEFLIQDPDGYLLRFTD